MNRRRGADSQRQMIAKSLTDMANDGAACRRPSTGFSGNTIAKNAVLEANARIKGGIEVAVT